MTDHRSPEEIERDIERERAGLSHTLEDLQDRFSIDGIVRQFGDQLRDHGGDIGASVSRSVKENPMALALTGVGLAWMIFGNDRRSSHRQDPYIGRPAAGGYRDDFRRPADRPADHAGGAFDPMHGAQSVGTTPEWVHSHDETHDHGSAGRSAAERSRDLYKGAGQKLSDGTGAVSEKASGAARSMSDTAGGIRDSASARARTARDGLSDTAQGASDRAALLRARLAEGTETLGEEARARVIAARERAVRARAATLDYSRRGRETAMDFFEEQPLVAGALALAVGAAIGASLPRTRAEDSFMGEERDSLIEEAERIFAEEKAKVGAVARAARDEAKDMAEEAREKVAETKAEADRQSTSGTAAQDAADKAKSAGERVAGAARSEADKQHLGKPAT